MLHEFLTHERDQILEIAKKKAQSMRWTRREAMEAETGWELFYNNLKGLLHPGSAHIPPKRREPAENQGVQYLRLGYAITEAVQGYNIIYQAIMESAINAGYEISEEESKQLNKSLDSAIAQVVVEFEQIQTRSQGRKEGERLGFLAHELRNSLQSASIALEMVEEGLVSLDSQTGALIKSSMMRMGDLIDKALTNVRLQIEAEVNLQRLRAFEVISEVEVTAAYEARIRNVNLCIETSNNIEVVVDRQLFISALSNIVQNAMKFTHEQGTVYIRTRETDERVLIEVEDSCGGLPKGKIAELFEPGVQSSEDRSGVGLGLAIAKQALERNNGRLLVDDIPGKGCIFTIDLPKPDLTHL
jgi:signal transduction histidine kinase